MNPGSELHHDNHRITPIRPSIRKLGWMTHFAAWGILFFLPFFFFGNNQEITIITYLRFVLVPVSFILVFYANYFYLVQRFLFTKRTPRFILSNLLLIGAIVFVVQFVHQMIPDPIRGAPPGRPFQHTIAFYIGNMIMYILVAGLSVAIKMTNSWFRAESARQELEKSRSEAELQNLKSQLNPHFLFNTLNNIYSLVAISPDQAQEAVHGLSGLLRYVLYESSQQMVPLSKELDFIRNYIELMRIRLPEHVKVNVIIEAGIKGNTPIAPLLFISLIENAFKHGVSNNKPSFIELNISEKDGMVSCTICNSYFPKEATRDKSGSGIGVANLRKRLSLLYPNRHIFSSKIENDQYKSVLCIQPQ